MKRVTLIIAALLLVTGVATRAHSQAAAPTEQAPAEGSSAPAAGTETITGRIIYVKKRAGVFKVKDSTTGKTVTLKRGTLDIGSMRRGDRVTVTYSQNQAISMEPNRSAQ